MNTLKMLVGVIFFGISIMVTPVSANPSSELAKPRVGVAVIVFKDNKILLGKRKGSHGSSMYAPPGGNLEFQETVEACAIRELAEETGIISTNVILGPWTQNIIDAKKHYVSLFALVTAFEGEPMLLEPDKCEGWDWYDLDNLPNRS